MKADIQRLLKLVRLPRQKPLRLLLLFLAFTASAPVYSANNTEAIKNEAVELLGRLQQLEQQMLYPAHTQVSVFLSLSASSSLVPQAISLEIDSRKVSTHVYTTAEVVALRSGGVQRLYSGNIAMGKHALLVKLNHRQEDGSLGKHEVKHRFNKNEKTHYIEIEIGAGALQSGRPDIAIRSVN